MKKNRFNFILIGLLIFMPFFDFMTSIFAWNGQDFILSTLVKGIVFLFCFLLLWKRKEKKLFFLLGGYFLIYLISQTFMANPFLKEFTFLLQVFYLPLLILFFVHKKDIVITDGFLTGICFLYLLLYLIPSFFGLGHNIGEIYAGKDVYLSYFFSGNELVGVFLVLLPTTIHYLATRKNMFVKVVGFFFLFLLITKLTTKAFLLGIFLILGYFFVLNFKKIWKYKKIILLGSIGTFLLLIFILPKTAFFHNFNMALDFYQIHQFSDIFSITFIDKVLLSSRFTYFYAIWETFLNGSLLQQLFGLGRSLILAIKDIEIDMFDILFSQGIIGFLVYIGTCFYAVTRKKIRGYYCLGFVLPFFVSFFTGHILISPMVTIWMAVMFANHESSHKSSSILLVSNMYPSLKYKHYGSFVKNISEELEKKFFVTRVVMNKQDSMLRKIFSYIVFYFKAFWLAFFGNYDYYYVHFISHSSFPVVLAKFFNRKTKLVLNVHGNDLVVDRDSDKWVQSFSKFALTYADNVISPSVYFADVLEKKYHVSKEIISVYPAGGVNFDRFYDIPKKIACEKLGLDFSKMYYGFIGRMELDKGWDTVLDAIVLMKKQGNLKNRIFLFLGSGSEATLLDEKILKEDISDVVIRFSFVNQSEMVDYYNILDGFLFPTRRKSESLGLVGLEAMACKTFVIGTNTYGPREYLFDEETGFVMKPNDPIDLVHQIDRLENLTFEEKKKIVEQAYLKSKEYDLNAIEERLWDIFPILKKEEEL